MLDVRMLIVRVASAAAIYYGAIEFMKDPENLEEMVKGGGELWDEMYDWGHHKFMGTVDPNQQIEVKKSARQIYAEAFMDDDNIYMKNTHFTDYADEDALREAYEEEQKLSEEERARKKLDELLDEDDDEEERATDDAKDSTTDQDATGEDSSVDDSADGEEEEDLLDRLTGNIDDDDEEEEEAN